MATAINDFVQGVVMFIGIAAVIAAVLMSKGGLSAAMEKLAQVSDPAVSSTPGIFPEIMRSPINCGVIAMFIGLILVPIVSIFTKKPHKKLTDEAFSCYEKKTTVEQKTSLGN